MIRLNDIYPAVQGEGCLTGQAMALIRLQGCGVGCGWCDTKETWSKDENNLVPTIQECLGTNNLWTIATPGAVALAAREAAPSVRWALVTGGEPAEQSLAGFVAELHKAGFKAAVETSGTALGHVGAGFDWACVSPKIGMPGGKAVLPGAMAAADEVKMVVGKPTDIDALNALLVSSPTKPGVEICLQPLSTNPKATELCIETVLARGWRLSLQTHKYLGLR